MSFQSDPSGTGRAHGRRRRPNEGGDVKVLTRRRGVVALVLVVLVAASVAAYGAAQRGGAFDALHEGGISPHALVKGDPDAHPAIAGHPGDLGSPDTYAAEQLANLAYPSNVLKASTLNVERSYYSDRIRGRGRFSKRGWQLVGPSTATEPAVLNFFDFQASDLQVSGRDTAMAFDPNSCDAS